MDKVFNRLRNLDAYPKINEDFYSRTLSGGVITLVSSIFIALLFISEFRRANGVSVLLFLSCCWLNFSRYDLLNEMGMIENPAENSWVRGVGVRMGA